MSFSADNLVLVLGLGGFFFLLLGCLVVVGYLVCVGLPARTPPKSPRTDLPAGLNLFPW